MRKSLKYLCGVMLLVGVPAAYAVPIEDVFTFQSTDLPIGGSAIVDASPTPGSYVPGVSFTLNPFTFLLDGVQMSIPVVTFLTAGGVDADGTILNGDTLFMGPESSPTFKLGTFNLGGLVDIGNGPVPLNGTLTITQLSSVPEPGSLVLLGSGVLGLAGLVRRRLWARVSVAD